VLGGWWSLPKLIINTVLFYVIGNSQIKRSALIHWANLDEGCIPQTIEDAMTVVRELSYQFLWVDKYCIDPE